MRLQTNLVRRGARYYYRGRVPQDLQGHYGKTELLISLKTSDRHEANHALMALKASLFGEFARLRQHEGPQAVTTHSPNSHKTIRAVPARTGVFGPSLDDLIAYWASQGEKRPRTIMETETAKRRLLDVAGALPSSGIEKRHVVALKDKLLADGRSVATIKKQINLLKAVFEIGVANDLIENNPFHGVKLVKPKVERKARVPFDSDDLKRIFGSPVYSRGDRPTGGSGEAAIWFPRIALWTGMRLEEIGQLTVDDIQTTSGVPYIHVTDAGAHGKKLKTSSSKRRIPIHQSLISAGFLGYVEQMRASGQVRLFPLVVSAEGLQVTANWSKWFGRYLRDVIGVQDERKVFHSFRHGFKDACRQCGISKEIHDRLTGHANRDVGDQYGGENFPLAPLADAIKRLTYFDCVG